LKKGDDFPALTGRTLTGEQFSFSSLKGHPFLLKLGTTWCPTCGQESAEIETIRKFMGDNGIKFIEVFIQEGSAAVIKSFTKSGHTQPDTIILDAGDIGKALGVYQIPRVMMINANMKVFRDGGPLRSETLQQQLQEMLNGK